LLVQVSRVEEKAMSTQLKMLQSELESGQRVWELSGCTGTGVRKQNI
jgi:hypothetical protein